MIRSENKAHEAACIFSEMQRQAAMATAFTTAAVKSADIAHYRRIIASAKLNGVEPQGWLTDVLERTVSGRTKRHQLDTFLPWNWDNAAQV